MVVSQENVGVGHWIGTLRLLSEFAFLGACVGGAGFSWLSNMAPGVGAVIGVATYIVLWAGNIH
jgi:hypothetical protein